MPRLFTRCISQDYKTVIDNQDVIDRGEMDVSDLEEVLHEASYLTPHSSDPDSPYRPAIGVVLTNEHRPTFFRQRLSGQLQFKAGWFEWFQG